MEKPILFSGEMVRAILDGRKTQTRRVIKDLPGDFPGGVRGNVSLKEVGEFLCLPTSRGYKKSPYGKPGDLLWVRETWATDVVEMPPIDANGNPTMRECVVYRADGDEGIYRWRPSIHMTRRASRLTLRVVDVRVERVQEISEEDARAEGVNLATWELHHRRDDSISLSIAAIEEFKHLWDSINAKRGYSWDSNPWVWVVEFETVTS